MSILIKSDYRILQSITTNHLSTLHKTRKRKVTLAKPMMRGTELFMM
jgi:hypothetical protein